MMEIKSKKGRTLYASDDADSIKEVVENANLENADLRGAKLPDNIPIVENIDAKIYDTITKPGCDLNMSEWHTCETTHCRAGWAIHLAGKAGYDLEEKFNSTAAGALIYAKSRPNAPIPDFYAENKDAWNSIADDAKKYSR